MTKPASKTSVWKHPAAIAGVVAALSVGALVIGDHTDLLRKKADEAPRGQTLAEAMKDGATLTPTPPDSPIRPAEPGPKRADPPVVTTPPPATH
jgi:hypothetical protein